MAIQAVILGAGGYVGGELLRLLHDHPEFELAAAASQSAAGQPIPKTFPHLGPALDGIDFVTPDDWASVIDTGSDIALFSAAPHGTSAVAVAKALDSGSTRNLNMRIVDSSADFRYQNADQFASIYGIAHPQPGLLKEFQCAVPEHLANTEKKFIGHPGCFATATLLAAVPLVSAGLAADELFVAAITGSTGSGRKPQPGTHHPERHGNLYAYKPLRHRHAPEVKNLIEYATGSTASLSFVPHSGSHARGIYATLQTTLTKSITTQQLRLLFEDYYRDAGFVRVIDGAPKLKNVVASNYAHIGVSAEGDTVVVMCAIDNLVKGAAGGAVQWMNRLWSLPDTTGLLATAPAWT